MFIMVDGIDGGGKSTVVAAWKEYLGKRGYKIFDLKKYLIENNHYPEIAEFIKYDFIFSAEPTHTGVGKILREELANANNTYPAEAIAEAHSLDRTILYDKVLIPAIKNKINIIQDRGLSTSLAYQPAHDSALTMKKVAGLVGNRTASKYHPDHLLIIDINPTIAYQRLAARHDKIDNAIFEKKDFLKKAALKFKRPDFKKFFSNIGTKIHYLSGERKIDIMKQEATALLKKILT